MKPGWRRFLRSNRFLYYPRYLTEVEGIELAANERPSPRCRLAEEESAEKFASLSRREKDMNSERSD